MPERKVPLWSLGAYAGMLAAAVGLFELIRSAGAGLVAPAPLPGSAPTVRPAAADTLPHVLLALVAIVLAARAVGWLFRRVGQPAVIGEVVAGLMLGPSLLGRISPAAYAFLLPPSVAPFLGLLAQVGVILFMFLVGVELDTGLLRRRGHASVAISHASILVPFILGAAIALLLYPRLSSSDVSFTVFALFLGVALSITAFPVLARILTDRGLQRSRLGVVALTCAAVDDATAWCLLAALASIAAGQSRGGLVTLAMTVAYVALMLLVVRPVVARLIARRAGKVTQGTMAAVFVALLLSALATEYIGIHAIFGAFLLGALIPHDSDVAAALHQRLLDLVAVLLLPAFFAFTGMRTQVGLVDGAVEWLLCGLIIVAATAGKLGGTTVAARLSGLDWRDSLSLGVLMNTRGLMELVVASLGLDLGIISPTVFAMLVLMALATTLATGPIIGRLARAEDQ